MTTRFTTRVSGIPCQCEVDYNAPTLRDFEFRILDRRGYPAPWLERKLTDESTEVLFHEYTETQQQSA